MNRLSVVVEHFVAFGIEQVIGHAAELRTSTSVGTPSGQHFRYIAASRIADTEGTVDERFQFDIRHRLMDSAYLADTQFTRQHDAFETHVAKPFHLFRRPIVTLRGSVQTNRREIQIEQVQVLNDERVHTY